MEQEPGCYHDMLDYLSEKTGLSKHVKLSINSVYEIKSFNERVHFIYKGVDLGQMVKHQIKGGITELRTMDKSISLPMNTVFDEIYEVKFRKFTDFNYPIEKAGKYKDSLGGGWYSKVDQYKIDDRLFAMMECTC